MAAQAATAAWVVRVVPAARVVPGGAAAQVGRGPGRLSHPEEMVSRAILVERANLAERGLWGPEVIKATTVNLESMPLDKTSVQAAQAASPQEAGLQVGREQRQDRADQAVPSLPLSGMGEVLRQCLRLVPVIRVLRGGLVLLARMVLLVSI